MAVLQDLLRAQGKALPDHRFFHSDSPITTYIPGGGRGREKGLLSQREAKRHLGAYGGDQAIDWVMDAVDLYANAAALASWHFEKDGEAYYSESNPKRPHGSKIADRRAAAVLDQPNPFMDYTELVQLLVIDLLVVGNGYWLKWRSNDKGQPLALYRLSPMHVKVKPGIYGVEGYTYQPEGVAEPIDLSVQDVIHFKRPNPHSLYYGLGVIQGGGRPFDFELAVTDSTASYFENKADPSLIVQSERRVPRDVFNKLRTQLRARTAGTKRTGELLVLEAGLKASTLTPTARDAMYAELADKSRDRVLAMFHVNPALLGVPGVVSGSDKIQDIRRDFTNNSLRPFLDRLQKLISDNVAQAWDYTFHIDYRYTMPQEDAIKLSGDLGAVPGVRVIDIREFLVETGVLRTASTGDKTIDEMVLNLPGEDLGPDGEPLEGENGFADRNLPGEAGRPPKGENTKRFPRAGEKTPAGAAARKQSGKSVEDMLRRLEEIKALRSDDNVRVTVGNRLPDEVRPEDVNSAVRTRDVDALTNAMRAELADAAVDLERGLLDAAEGKAITVKEISSKLRNSPAWNTFRIKAAEIMERYAAQGVSAAAVHHQQSGIDAEEVARELTYRKGGVRQIVQNLKDAIVRKAGDAAKNGGERKDIEKAIQAAVKDWGTTQAETVAMTEMVHAYNEGALLALEAQGNTEVYVEDGEDHDKPCQDANGQVWTIEHAREHRLEHPRCRRAFLAIPSVG